MSIIRWSLLLIISLTLVSCACPQVAKKRGEPFPSRLVSSPTQKPAVIPSPRPALKAQSTVVATARRMLGTPYRYGGADPSGFDCSGLVSYAYRSVGIRVPRTSGEQFRQSVPVESNGLQPGDLLFFRLRPPKISHVAIYEGDGRFIHAPSSCKRVSYASLDNPYWRKHLVGAGRF